MKLALHRSIAFWSGILLLVFISLAWQRSYSRFAGAESGGWGVSNMCGGFLSAYSPNRAAAFFWGSRPADLFLIPEAFPPPVYTKGKALSPYDVYWTYPDDDSKQTVVHFLKGRERADVIGDHRLFIPHWLILLAVAIPWTALLLWRARRRKRAITAAGQRSNTAATRGAN